MIVVYCLVIAGAVVAWVRTVMLLAIKLNSPEFDRQITKLVMAGNADRANKLCSAAPNIPHCKISQAAIKEALDIHGASENPGEAMIRERVLGAYREAEKVERERRATARASSDRGRRTVRAARW